MKSERLQDAQEAAISGQRQTNATALAKPTRTLPDPHEVVGVGPSA